MDRVIKWSPEAAEDLESIAEFIARDSAFYAKAVVSKILAASEHVTGFPFSGRIVPEIGDKNIKAIIVILAIIHGKRVIENFTRKFAGS